MQNSTVVYSTVNWVCVSEGSLMVDGSEFHRVVPETVRLRLSVSSCSGARYFTIATRCRPEMTSGDRCRGQYTHLSKITWCCIPPTVSYLQYLVIVLTLTAAVPSQSPAPQSGTLPDFIRDPTISAECFRRLLKTYLFAWLLLLLLLNLNVMTTL